MTADRAVIWRGPLVPILYQVSFSFLLPLLAQQLLVGSYEIMVSCMPLTLRNILGSIFFSGHSICFRFSLEFYIYPQQKRNFSDNRRLFYFNCRLIADSATLTRWLPSLLLYPCFSIASPLSLVFPLLIRYLTHPNHKQMYSWL